MNKLKHFYFNKYIVSQFSEKKYFLSYNFKYKALWFRTYKVASRTINEHMKESSPGDYIYSSEVGYIPRIYKNFFKFAFVRHPVDKFISAWKDKVLNQNYFQFDTDIYEKMKNLDHFIDWVETLNINNCDEHLRAQNAIIDLENVNFIGYFENFDEDFKHVANQIKMPLTKVLHKNKSNNQLKKIPDELIKRIEKVYETDLNTFYLNRNSLI